MEEDNWSREDTLTSKMERLDQRLELKLSELDAKIDLLNCKLMELFNYVLAVSKV